MQELDKPTYAQGERRETIKQAGQHQSVAPQNVGDLERLASAVGGGALAIYSLSALRERLPLALLGGYLIYRGASGSCALYQGLGVSTATAAKPAHIEHNLTIDIEPAELYAFWRDFSNLPMFMRHLKEVQVLDSRRSHWVAKAPAGMSVEWDAEIFMEKEGELIAWRSLPGAQVANAGSVRFRPAPAGRGTQLRVVLEYVPPAGALGRVVARLFGEEPAQQVSDDLRSLKKVIETGEIDGAPQADELGRAAL
jgi:uncharacterized membrane protein